MSLQVSTISLYSLARPDSPELSVIIKIQAKHFLYQSTFVAEHIKIGKKTQNGKLVKESLQNQSYETF